MSWLKSADDKPEASAKESAETVLADLLTTLKTIQTEALQGGQNSRVWIEQVAREAVARAESFLGKKEGSVFDNADYQKQDLNVGDSGQFEEEHVLDRKPNYSVSPGPASTVPGSPGNSPDIPTGLT